MPRVVSWKLVMRNENNKIMKNVDDVHASEYDFIINAIVRGERSGAITLKKLDEDKNSDIIKVLNGEQSYGGTDAD